MRIPTVSFVVPCYKLAHLLPECINSILSQSYEDFEILIMDDCSPDNTAEVARSFKDSRVRYIRNDPNLGHLRNYNKGIELACGRYIWLISADDCLRRTYLLKQYVEQLDRYPSVGYAWCPAVGLKDGQETGLLKWSFYSSKNQIIKGHTFLRKLLKANCVPAPSGLVRRECYDRLGVFPLDMPYAGDWYLWCLFALQFDVAYFSEPMVCYREHELSMTNTLMAKSIEVCYEEDVAIPWIIKKKADASGFHNVSIDSLRGLGYIYGRSMVSERYPDYPLMTWEFFEKSLDRHTDIQEEKVFLRSQACAAMADEFYSKNDIYNTKEYYKICLNYDPLNFMVRIKKLILVLGRPGKILRNTLRLVFKKKIVDVASEK